MAEFKLTISDPKSGKSYQREVKDDQAKPFVGLKIGASVKGELIDLPGYEFDISGGSDNCGFPMRKGILMARKRILAKGGVGVQMKKRVKIKGNTFVKTGNKGQIVRKTVCGETINDNISQINLKITKMGKDPLDAAAPAEGGEAPAEGGEAPKEEAPKEAPAEKKEEAPKEEKKEEKPAEDKKE